MATTQKNAIKKFMHSLDINAITSGKDALSQAICYASGGYFTDATTAINKMLAELDTYGAKNFLSKRCGINLSNTDTGAITGYDAGNFSIKTAKSIVPESGKLNTNFDDNSFKTKDGLTILLYKAPKNDNERYIWRALKTWWAESALGLIEESYGYSFKDSDATVKKLTIKFENNKKGNYLAYTGYPQYINGHYTRLLVINTAYYNDFSSGDVNGETDKAGYLDRTLAHELTHVVMMSKVDCFKSLPQFVLEGLAELTHGIDDLRKGVIETLANNPSKLKSSLSLSSGTGSANAYAGGYIFLRWFAKQAAQNYPAVNEALTLNTGKLIFGDDDGNSIVGDTGRDTIFGAAGDDTIKGGKGKDILWGEDGNDIIYGGSNNDTLNGGAGKDTLSGGSGDDLLTGGTGKDVFVYTAGKDVITDYATGDKISLNVADISSSKVSGSDVIFYVGTGQLEVQKAKGKRIILIDTTTSKEYSTIGGGTTLIVNDLSSSPVTVKSDVEIIDGTERTTNVKIMGNSLDNTIIGGSAKDTIKGDAGKDSINGGAGNDKLYGDAGNDKIYGDSGNDSLWGGSGNDSLWGGSGADTFIYKKGDGNDVIFGFDNNDTLTLDNLTFTSSYNKTTGILTFKVDGGSVSLKNFTATTFHINDKTYKFN